MSIFYKDEIQQLQTVVEQLEICCDYLKENSDTKSRIVIILLDNISETILNKVIINLFEEDDFLKWIVPQKYTAAKKDKTKRFFPEKISTIKQHGKLSKDLLETLNICHKYRNAIYHRDEHNPNIITIIAKILYLLVVDLLKDTKLGFGSLTIGGLSNSITWLMRYSINDSVINFNIVVPTICEKLESQIDIDEKNAIQAFGKDLDMRISSLIKLINNELPWKTENELNHIIKWFEYKDEYPHSEDEISLDYRNIRYKITQKNAEEVNPSEYQDKKVKFEEDYQAKVETYQQKITFSVLKYTEKAIKNIIKSKSLFKAFHSYFVIDDRLSKFEKYLDQISIEVDNMVQREIDIRRGK